MKILPNLMLEESMRLCLDQMCIPILCCPLFFIITFLFWMKMYLTPFFNFVPSFLFLPKKAMGDLSSKGLLKYQELL